MKNNYAKLLGRMKERGLTQEQLANEIGKNKGTLGGKLKGRVPFTTKEIDDICKVLDISNERIVDYFFAD
jgi:transcriptional regulator with XRE-family HTH domain